MSAAEVIEEIKKLSPRDREVVGEFLRELSTREPSRVSDEFKRVADEVFATNSELFRKLAK